MTDDYMQNIDALGVDVIDHFPRCTETMGEIIELTKTLVAKGFAYEAQGDVYFEVAKCPDYGKLSHRGVEAMRGEGGGMAERKRSSGDFALWKSAKPGEPSWPSPWGPGRPGWHIECSAMSGKLLGEIVRHPRRRAGPDLPAPRKRNRPERVLPRQADGQILAAQRADAGQQRGGQGRRPPHAARRRRSGGPGGRQDQQVEGLGAVPRDAQAFSGETIRFFLLSTHYRRPIDFSEERIREVETGMDTFYRFFKRFERITGERFYGLPAAATRKQGDEAIRGLATGGASPRSPARRSGGSKSRPAGGTYFLACGRGDSGVSTRRPPAHHVPSIAAASWRRWTTISTRAAGLGRSSTWSGRSTSTPRTRSSKTRPSGRPRSSRP